MKEYYYVGLDIHKKTITYCVKKPDGEVVDKGTVRATRRALAQWVETLPRPWAGSMEATLFTGWVYDFLLPHADELKVGHPLMLKAIGASKKKSDRIDARTLADLLRCGLMPECYMAPQEIRELRRVLRYRNLMVQESSRMKNKTAGLLMEMGAQYSKRKLHGKRYFSDLLQNLDEVPPSVVELLKMTRAGLEMFASNQKRLVEALENHPALRERVRRLMTIPCVGVVTALTWALEIGEPQRFASQKQAVSYCGLCSAQNESAGKAKRGPLSKQRNKHLQTILIEAAKLAPLWNQQLDAEYVRQRQRGANSNRATLAVARKLVAYLLCVDKTRKDFEYRTAV